MRKAEKRRYVAFFAVGLVLLALIPGIFGRQTAIAYYLNEGRAQVHADGARAGGFLELPKQEGALECCLPERAAVDRPAQNGESAREARPSRYQMFRFWTVVFAMVLFPYVIFCTALRRFCSREILFWQDIDYIHSIDGKKGKCFLYVGKMKQYRRRFWWKNIEKEFVPDFC